MLAEIIFHQIFNHILGLLFSHPFHLLSFSYFFYIFFTKHRFIIHFVAQWFSIRVINQKFFLLLFLPWRLFNRVKLWFHFLITFFFCQIFFSQISNLVVDICCTINNLLKILFFIISFICSLKTQRRFVLLCCLSFSIIQASKVLFSFHWSYLHIQCLRVHFWPVIRWF